MTDRAELIEKAAGGWVLTLEDLQEILGDTPVYEWIDGTLVVNPAATAPHQRGSGRIFRLLTEAAPADLEVLMEFGLREPHQTELVPDVAVLRRPDPAEHYPRGLVLAVEVASPSSTRIDQTIKRRAYADAGIPSYWLVDLDVPSITVLSLREGDYVETARVTGDDELGAEAPFAVRVRPSALLG
jgi:Uma2 family endonuclease